MGDVVVVVLDLPKGGLVVPHEVVDVQVLPLLDLVDLHLSAELEVPVQGGEPLLVLSLEDLEVVVELLPELGEVLGVLFLPLGDLELVRELPLLELELEGLFYPFDEMIAAHIAAGMVVGEPFREQPGNVAFQFGQKEDALTSRVTGELPTIGRDRLQPPPTETYSLHRKLSGAFLAAIKLRSSIHCRDMLMEIIDGYEFDE